MEDDSYELTPQFDERYAVAEQPAMRRAELGVIGCDYGATSYTTRAQADRLAGKLRLAPGKRLLEVGSGAGWPGIYLAASTGCRAVLSDLPLEGLRVSARRVRRDGVDGSVVAASGADLPLRHAVFDAVTSSDVFC